MLTRKPVQHHQSSQARRASEPDSADNLVYSLTDFYTPLLELHNPHDPSSSSEPSPTATDSSHMQSSLASSNRSTGHMSIKVHPYGSAQDSGLGIRTHEDHFLSDYDSYINGHLDLSHFDTEHDHSRGAHSGKLASPFDDHCFASAHPWPLSDASMMLNNMGPTPYSSNPDPYLYQQAVHFGSAQYMTPQSTTSHTSSQYESTPNVQFKRPLLRHSSTASVVPSSTMSMNFPSSTTMEPSPYQWNSHNEVPMWHDSAACQEEMSEMLDYVGYGNFDQASDDTQGRAMNAAGRKKPHLRPSLSESCVTRSQSPARVRGMSIPEHQYVGNMTVHQLPLPPLPPSVLVNTPHSHAQTPMYRKPRSLSSTPQRWRRPSSPPPSDLNNPNTPFLAPVRQDPTFPGDLYTPRYKRRTSGGRWEGWCGYCQPGRWLDLKNSRFWEDKLRNHGICAKTKVRFTEPERIRWVTMDGKVCSTVGVELEVGDQGTDQKKREGLCGVCRTWVPMDGMRTKARDRAVGWWMHAYKCHDHDQCNEQQNAAS